MTQVSKCQPRSPRQAARRRAAVDRLLDTTLFKALSDQTRATLLACLIKCGRPCSVSELAECCSVDFSVVARHLSVLARAGAVEANKQGRTVWYSARCAHLCETLHALAEAIEDWCPQLEARESSDSCPCEDHGGGND
ncbi:MAG: transcriptional regulator [Planctomycetota bacterium]|nr:MAG: transcriptional regulator [Planctomycetota bacterium]